MTLNFSHSHSHCSLFPSLARFDDELAPRSVAATPCWIDWGMDDPIPYAGWATGANCSPDPIELLPADPFGMGLTTTFKAAIATWVGPGDFELCPVDALVSGLNHLFYQDSPASSSSRPQLVVEGVLNRRAAEPLSSSCAAETPVEGGPHEGLLFALGYLGVKDLLTVERVCRSLYWAVRNDPLLWRCIHIDSPLSERITDDDLLQLTQRSQGSLRCLSLVGCARITDDGLKRVLESNPRLKKLSVPGCVRMSVEGLVNNLKTFKSLGNRGIKHLKLGRLFNVTQEHFEELKSLLDLEPLQEFKTRKLHFYHNDRSSLTCDDERALDIEMCPVCQKLRLVYDCPAESCQGKEPDTCRACDVCIARCVHCGRCIKDCEYVETFCLEYLCSGCWKLPLQCPESSEK